MSIGAVFFLKVKIREQQKRFPILSLKLKTVQPKGNFIREPFLQSKYSFLFKTVKNRT